MYRHIFVYTETLVGGKDLMVQRAHVMRPMTGSISKQKGGTPTRDHDLRSTYQSSGHYPEHIDPTRTADNDIIVDRTYEEVYKERFAEAVSKYNVDQVAKGRPQRQITDYLSHIQKSKQQQIGYEWVIQVGDHDRHPDEETCKRIYREWIDGFRKAYGKHFEVVTAVTHVDEPNGTPHMHVIMVPVAECIRGLTCRNSLNQAIKQSGFDTYLHMLEDWDKLLTQVMRDHDLWRTAGDREKQCGGVDINTYKRTMAYLDDAEEQVGIYQKQVEQAKSEVETLQRQKSGLEVSVNTLTDRVTELQQTRGNIEHDISEAKREREQLEDTIEKSRGIYRALIQGCTQQEYIQTGLKEVLGSPIVSEQGQRGGEGHVWGVNDLIDEYNESYNACADMSEKVNTLTTQRDNLEHEVTGLKALKESLESSLEKVLVKARTLMTSLQHATPDLLKRYIQAVRQGRGRTWIDDFRIKAQEVIKTEDEITEIEQKAKERPKQRERSRWDYDRDER